MHTRRKRFTLFPTLLSRSARTRNRYAFVLRRSSSTPEAFLALSQNHLLALLPAKDRLRLLDSCESVDLTLEQVLAEPGEQTRHVYFPLEGFISLVTDVKERTGIEVGMVGSEGMLGAQLVLGVGISPMRALVQGAGIAWRMPARAFRAELACSAALQKHLNRYIYVLMAQQAGAAACLRFHLTGPRLARWLLMSQDRAKSDQFHITQELLAYMLGMRRVGITTAASDLQRSGLIAYQRGEMTVLDRAGLEALACSCYASDRSIYADTVDRSSLTSLKK